MLAVEFSLELLKILIAVSILYRCQLKNTSVHRSLSGIDLALQYEYGYLPTRIGHIWRWRWAGSSIFTSWTLHRAIRAQSNLYDPHLYGQMAIMYHVFVHIMIIHMSVMNYLF